MKKLILFGAGIRGKKTFEYLQKYGISPECFVDNSVEKQGTWYCGIEVRNPQVILTDPDYLVCITVLKKEEIRSQLIKMGLSKESIVDELSLVVPLICKNEKRFGYILEHTCFNKENTILFECKNGLELGGIQSWTFKFGNALIERGHRVRVLSKKATQNQAEGPLRECVDYLDIADVNNMTSADLDLVIKTILNELPCTLVTSFPDDILMAGYIIKCFYPDQIRIVSVIHGGMAYNYDRYEILAPCVDLLVGVSVDIMEEMIARGVPEEKVRHILCPMECDKNIVHEYSKDEQPLKLAYGARLYKIQKRVDRLLDLIEQLEELEVNYRFDIAGDGPYKGEIEKFIRENKLEEKVNLKGTVDRKDMNAFWREHDVFVSVSDFEGNSLSMLEALGNGTVPVVSEVSGVKESVYNGYNGFYTDKENVKQMAKDIELLSKNKILLPLWGERCKKEVERKCNIDDIIDVFEVYIRTQKDFIAESEYRCSLFDKKFKKFADKRIGIYGTGFNAGKLIDSFSGYNFVTLIGDTKDCNYKFGKRVVELNEIVDLKLDIIIIAEMLKSAQRIYKKIGVFCRQIGVPVYNLYGWNMQDLNFKMQGHWANYPSYTYETLKAEIDKFNVISFNLVETLITRNGWANKKKFEFIETILKERNIFNDNFVNRRRIIENENAAQLLSLEDIYVKLAEENIIKSEDIKEIIKIEESVEENNIVAREVIVDAVNYAHENKKKICIISDSLWSSEFHYKIFEKIGIKAVDKLLIFHQEKCSKFDGIFRKIQDNYFQKTILHIGNEESGDGLMPYMYGMHAFTIMTGYERFKNQRKYNFDYSKIDWGNNSLILNTYILENYRNPFMTILNEKSSPLLEDLMNLISVHSSKKLPQIKYETDIDLDPVLNYKSKIIFADYERPKVSIVIPVFNQFEYTYKCLKAIYENTIDVSYEIIVADDCSSDMTKDLDEYVSGVTVLHNNSNMRFLLNCNNAAQKARGKYILFLNNDTQVQYNWLSPMVEVLDRNEQVGMVGAKLIYPDGYLQEAGGIVWKDASAWNYGNQQDPEDAKYSYVKSVDYVSGASMMIRAELWNEIGGFDERFAPAYYEDTDLAFSVRQKGYDVVFQPKSVVVHFEGVSNGVDIQSGLKSYQEVNAKKFLDKWRQELDKNHFTNGNDIYLAKDRGQCKKQILVVDHYVPNYDRDAGGRCTYMYLKIFLQLGFKVTFLGDNFAKPEPYSSELNQMGVEILYGENYSLNKEEWLKGNLRYFDYVYLQRPHISIKYIDLVKRYSSAKVFYFAHDLHHIREYREYVLTQNIEKLLSAKKWKIIEDELFSKADVGHVVGSYEQMVLQKQFPDKIIRNIPLYVYEKVPEKSNSRFRERRDIIYVGGFGHGPNIDAVEWFATEIFPTILEKIPEVKWYVVGGSVPENIKRFASDNIIFTGYISDEELEILYNQCRLSVVPLRVGAGVKGKVVEAAYFQIPLITTSIGAEGLSLEEEAFLIEDDAKKFAELVCKTYNDEKLLERISQNQRVFVRKYFTEETAKNILLEDLI